MIRDTLTFVDVFCGAGGSSIGLAAAGYELKLAANHWDRAIETHSANFRHAEHLCADVSNYDMRRLPTTDVGWFSPECTWHSPAGGRKRMRAQLDMFDDYLPDAAGVRSRATMWDVVRATEVHRYAAVLVENVVEVAAWELWDVWLDAMRKLGYREQIVSVSAAHVGDVENPWAPQWRDRLYIVFTRTDVPLPDVAPRPIAWCVECDELVYAIQAWKRTDRPKIGKYGQQYLYRCPNTACKHAVLEPFVLPAASAIDWTDLGTRIGDRARPLADATMRRIKAGLEMFGPTVVKAAGNTWERGGAPYRMWPAHGSPLMARVATGEDGIVVTVNHDGHDGRAYPVDQAPLAPRTTKIGDAFVLINRSHNRSHGVDEPLAPLLTANHHGIVSSPFVVNGQTGGIESRVDPTSGSPMRTIVANGRGHHALVIPMRRNGRTRAADGEPLSTIAAGGNHHGFLVKQYGGNCKDRDALRPVDEPLGAVTTKDHHWLVVPYRRGRATPATDPLHTLATRDSGALVGGAIDVEDCNFRMLTPDEHLRGQRFPSTYIVHGNKSERTKQAGNAVASNVAQWLAGQLAEVLA